MFLHEILLSVTAEFITGSLQRPRQNIKYEHSSARYYINGKHSLYEVVDVERIFYEKIALSPESAEHKARQ